MPDNTKRRAPEDRKRISLKQKWERRWWAKSLGLTPLELVLVVRLAGSSVKRVRAALSDARRAI